MQWTVFCLDYSQHCQQKTTDRHNDNNNNPICKAPECQKTSVAVIVVARGAVSARALLGQEQKNGGLI